MAGYTQKSIYGKTRSLEIRSMADGSLQPTTGLHLPPNAALAWEDADHLLVGVRGDRGNAFVRCSVAGECERATDWLGKAGHHGAPPDRVLLRLAVTADWSRTNRPSRASDPA